MHLDLAGYLQTLQFGEQLRRNGFEFEGDDIGRSRDLPGEPLTCVVLDDDLVGKRKSGRRFIRTNNQRLYPQRPGSFAQHHAKLAAADNGETRFGKYVHPSVTSAVIVHGQRMMRKSTGAACLFLAMR